MRRARTASTAIAAALAVVAIGAAPVIAAENDGGTHGLGGKAFGGPGFPRGFGYQHRYRPAGQGNLNAYSGSSTAAQQQHRGRGNR